VVREKASAEHRDIERALTRFIAKTGDTENLFPDDPYAFPCESHQLAIVTRTQYSSFNALTFFFPTGLIPRTLRPSNDFTLLNGWICLHGVSD